MGKPKKVYFLSLLLILIALLLSIIPDFYKLSITPPGTTFPLIHNNAGDYFSYLSYMHQGYEGHWLTVSRFTPESFSPKFIFTFFIFLGHMSRITGISLPVMYFLSRIIFSLFLMISIACLSRNVFKDDKDYFLAITLVFFSTGFWTIGTQTLKDAPWIHLVPVKQFMVFWTHFDPIQRTSYLPHHLASLSLSIISVLLLFKAIETRKIAYSFFAGFLGLIATLVVFSTVLNILGGLCIAALFYIFGELFSSGIHNAFINIKRSLLFIFLCALPFFLLTSLSFIYLFLLLKEGFPWSAYQTFGLRLTYQFSIWEYLLSLGPTLLLTLIGLPFIWQTKKALNLFLLGWIVFPLFGQYILIHFTPSFSNQIYFEATSYIPLGILAVFGIKQIAFILKDKMAIITIVIFLFMYFIPPLTSSIQKESLAFPQNYYNRFIPDEIFQGMAWLNENTPTQSVIISGGYFGEILPAFTHNRVVYGSDTLTLNSYYKHQEINMFFGESSPDKASEMIRKYNVSYVFFSLDTDSPREQFIKKLNLSEVFSNGKVRIFKTASS